MQDHLHAVRDGDRRDRGLVPVVGISGPTGRLPFVPGGRLHHRRVARWGARLGPSLKDGDRRAEREYGDSRFREAAEGRADFPGERPLPQHLTKQICGKPAEQHECKDDGH